MSTRQRYFNPVQGIIPIVVCVTLGAILTFIAWWLMDELEQKEQRIEFARLAEYRNTAVRDKIDDCLQVMLATLGLFRASNHVERDEFHAFVDPMLVHNRGLQAIGWIPHVGNAERAACEDRAEDDGLRGFTITRHAPDGTLTPAQNRDEYYPVYYVAPLEDNRRALGFDLASDAVRRRAISAARDSGKYTATPRVTLVSWTTDQDGVLVLLPKYRSDARVSTNEERRESIDGFVLAVLRLDEMLQTAVGAFDTGEIDIVLHDESASLGEQELARYGHAEGEGSAATVDLEKRGFVQRIRFPIGGRVWSVSSTPTPKFFAAHTSSLPSLVVIVGILFSVLTTAYVRLLVDRAVRTHRLVRERTAELTRQTGRLQREIDERRSAESALADTNARMARANAELEDRNAEVLQLAYAMSHDLQTPLASLGGAVEALERRLEDPTDAQRKWMGLIRSATRRMVVMLNDLMVYAKVGTQPTQPEHLDLLEQARIVAEELQAQALERGIQLAIKGESITVFAEEQVIPRTLTNLVGNAIKYMRGDDGHVTIETSLDGNTARLSVTDNGPGIPQTQLEDVFKPFKRATSGIEGTGLGLSIVRKLINGMGGRVWLESDGSTGTAAIIELPVADTISAETGRRAAA